MNEAFRNSSEIQQEEASIPKVVCLLSGGIDSVVAAYLVAQQGLLPVLVHFNNFPFSTFEVQRKVQLLANQLSALLERELTLYEVPHGPDLSQIVTKCRRNYTCVLCRRMMYRLAEQIAIKEGAKAIVTGESLGQVASQTLSNLVAESEAVKLLVLRPLIGLDKEKIVQVARRIGTYKTSVLPGHCCSATPKPPVIEANLDIIRSEEHKIDISALVRQAVEHAQKEVVCSQ